MNDIAGIRDEEKIYRADMDNRDFKAFASNPGPPQPVSNEKGNFKFPHEERFPLWDPKRGADGKVVLKDGLLVWKSRDLHLGMNTAIEAANAGEKSSRSNKLSQVLTVSAR